MSSWGQNVLWCESSVVVCWVSSVQCKTWPLGAALYILTNACWPFCFYFNVDLVPLTVYVSCLCILQLC